MAYRDWPLKRKFTLEHFYSWLAWKLPRGLVRWAAVRLGAHATTGPWAGVVVPDLRFMDALRRWDLTGLKAELDAEMDARKVDLFSETQAIAGPPKRRIIIPGQDYHTPLKRH